MTNEWMLRQASWWSLKLEFFFGKEILGAYDQRKLRIFNRLNTLGLITGILLPIFGFLNNDQLPAIAWLVACSPALIGGSVLLLNYFRRYNAGYMVYFTLYPLFSTMVYAANLDLGIELFFILYGALAIFFIPNFAQAIVSILLSGLSYFVVYVLHREYALTLSSLNYPFYVGIQLLALGFIFYALFIIKKENSGYQEELLAANQELARQKQLLEEQSAQLAELNALKNKLFSVIAHDLRNPIHALKNLFKTMEMADLPAEEIKAMVPDIYHDLHATTGLMENLLEWAKSQLQAGSLQPEEVDLAVLAEEIRIQLGLQAETKSIRIKDTVEEGACVWADRDMTAVVLRNLLSNALKYSPAGAEINLGLRDKGLHWELFVRDQGRGMDAATLEKIQENGFHSTPGTANEAGTGLGLVLCREFLARNGGGLQIQSEPGKGSEFSFTLPKFTRRVAPAG
jgi:two-component system sensor histidine kinase/response regulator